MSSFSSYKYRIQSYLAWRKGQFQEARYRRQTVPLEPAARPDTKPSQDQPNLVVLVLDSVRADSFTPENCPHLFAHCKPGTSFSRAYATANWTLPSHTSMLTGLYPSGHGAVRKQFMAYRPTPSYLPNVLRSRGYWCQAAVRMNWLHAKFGLGFAFDRFDQLSLADAAELFALCRPPREPFFIFINIGDTHSPYVCPTAPDRIGNAETHAAYNHGKLELGQDYFDRLRAQQDRCLQYVDSCFPDLAGQLPDHTRYIITADHGELYGEERQFGHSGILHPAVLHVPLMTNFRLDYDPETVISLKEIYSLALDHPLQTGWALAEHFACPDFLQPKVAFKKSLALFWEDRYLRWRKGSDWTPEEWRLLETAARRQPEMLNQLAVSFKALGQSRLAARLPPTEVAGSG